MQSGVSPRTPRRSAWVVLAFIISLAMPLRAQSRPDINDKELYVMGLRIVEETYNNSVTEADATKRQRHQQALQKDMNVSPADYAVLVAEAQAAHARILPDGARSLYGLERSAAIDVTLQRLATSLSKAGWANFQIFIKGKLRNSVTVQPLGSPNQSR